MATRAWKRPGSPIARHASALIASTLIGLTTLLPASAQGAKNKQLAAECDAAVKKEKDWDEFAKRRFLEQCLQGGAKPPKTSPTEKR